MRSLNYCGTHVCDNRIATCVYTINQHIDLLIECFQFFRIPHFCMVQVAANSGISHSSCTYMVVSLARRGAHMRLVFFGFEARTVVVSPLWLLTFHYCRYDVTSFPGILHMHTCARDRCHLQPTDVKRLESVKFFPPIPGLCRFVKKPCLS